MKTDYIPISLIIALTLITACVAAESGNQSEKNITAPMTVTIGDILEKGPSFESQVIEVTGKITSQCGSGCWFILSDESGDLYVTLRPSNFVIPPGHGQGCYGYREHYGEGQ